MESVVMHVDGNGVIWALAKCRVCGEVHKYLAAEAIVDKVSCKSCKRPMKVAGAIITASRHLPTNGDALRGPNDDDARGRSSPRD